MPDPIKGRSAIKTIKLPVKNGEKTTPGNIVFEDGKGAKVWHGPDRFGAKLEVGVEDDYEIEVSENNGYTNFKLVAWGPRPAKGKGGGFTPREPTLAEIHGLPVATILAACIDKGLERDEAGKWLCLYKGAIQNIGKHVEPAASPAAPAKKSEGDPVPPKTESPDRANLKGVAVFFRDGNGTEADRVEYRRLCTALEQPEARVCFDAQRAGVTNVVELLAYAKSEVESKQ